MSSKEVLQASLKKTFHQVKLTSQNSEIFGGNKVMRNNILIPQQT